MTTPRNPYYYRKERWWYSAIADWMIRNPDGKLGDCAKELGKGQATISLIINTDMFRDLLAQRKRDWQQAHDFGLQQKLTHVAQMGLDSVLDSLEKKRDQIPFQRRVEVTMSALDRLGYSPNKSTTNVQVNSSGPTQVVIPVSASQLEEARQALRLAESKRAEGPELGRPTLSPPLDLQPSPEVEHLGAEPQLGILFDSEDEDAPLTISSE